MSSDTYFVDDFDDKAFAQIDAIETAYNNQAVSLNPVASKHNASVHKEDSFHDLTLDLDDEDLDKLDVIEENFTGKKTRSIGLTRQMTLFGDVLPNNTQRNRAPSSQTLERRISTPRKSKEKKTKIWDQTAFAKSGKKRGKGRLYEEEEEEKVEFEQFPAPFIPPDEPPPPMKLKPDLLEIKHWFYPLNKPKRDYQFNIVKNSLFENTIISVPTGLGKTFIAGVIMLNYYRWFPEGKVVFVAPTKPLVSQQIEASHDACGIPGTDATEMTGEVAKSRRERLWQEKRVFYMTPQTFMNDLTTQSCDVMDIILLVVDEAHKATGDYAYNQIVRWMMAKNPHFRLIALTATPGSNPAAVQNLIDGLHISHIEIRDENSIDLRPYLYEKKIHSHCIRMPREIVLLRDSLEKLMDTYLKPLKSRGIMWPEQQAIKLHPYTARARIRELRRDQRGHIGQLSMLGNLAQVMGYLLEGTIGMAYSYLKEICTKDDASKNQQAQNKKLQESELFKKAVATFEACKATHNGSFPRHPKLDMAIKLLVNYFGSDGDADNDGGSNGGSDNESVKGNLNKPKAMVFVTHREAVNELVEALGTEGPKIRPSVFIGQGMNKHGKKGQSQKEQLEVVQKFQRGEFNVLVATCIGEEGLDIGEVDLIICYDAQKTPIRMLQRFGRTGRKRAGCVHLLLAEDREEFNLDKAQASYREVQKTIYRSNNLEFYGDVERLLPNHIKPVPLERMMEIKPYIREERGRGKCSPKRATGTKRKRNDDMMRNIPSGASAGFVSVAELIMKGSKKRKVLDSTTLEEEGEDDDLDRELEAGLNRGFGVKRTQSLDSRVVQSHHLDEENLEKLRGKGKMKRAATQSIIKTRVKSKSKRDERDEDAESEEERRTKTKRKTKRDAKSKLKGSSLTLSQQGRDDSIDRELDEGIPRMLKERIPFSPSRSSLRCSTPNHVKKSSLKDDEMTGLSDVDMEWEQSEVPFTQAGSHCLEDLQARVSDDSMAWLIEDDDDPDIVILSSSPVVIKNDGADKNIGVTDFKLTNERSSEKSQTQTSNTNVLELLSELDSRYSSPMASPKSKSQAIPSFSSMRNSIRPQASSKSPIYEDTQPPRQIGRLAHNRHLLFNESSSDAEDLPSPSQRRLRRNNDSHESEHQQKKKRKAENKSKTLTKRKHNPLLDYSAEHSGEEVSAGSSSDDDTESESDRLFIKDSPMTQASPSYDQTLAYRKGLMTQAPGSSGPVFAQGPTRKGLFGRMQPRVRRRVIDSSPPADDDYEFGSFVVDNDAEISYLTQADDSF